MSQYVIYQGKYFTIEWYYDSKGKSQAKDYFDTLPFERKKKFDYLIRRMGDGGKIQDEEKFRSEDDQIYAFKPQDRFLCFFIKGAKIIVTNAFEKKTQKLLPREKERALKLKQDYVKRVSEGSCYD